MSLYELIVLFINILQIKFYFEVFKPKKKAVKLPKITYESIILSGTNKNNEVGFVLNQEQGEMPRSKNICDYGTGREKCPRQEEVAAEFWWG